MKMENSVLAVDGLLLELIHQKEATHTITRIFILACLIVKNLNAVSIGMGIRRKM